MEPMNLGSPQSSPTTSPGVINQNFLPAFLMGEHQTATPRSATSPVSPVKSRNVSFKSTPVSATTTEHRQRLYPQLGAVQEQTLTPTSNAFSLSAVTEKPGPPARGLFDTLDGADYNRRDQWTTQTIQSPCSDRSNISPTITTTPQRITVNLNESLSRSQRKHHDDSVWVTVLGFPPNATSLVLLQFSQCGTIMDKRFPPEGNWVHLKYNSQYEAAKALALNGKLIANTIMIGVLPYNRDGKENRNDFSQSLPVTSPNRARSLTRPYVVSPQNMSTAVITSPNVPQKSSGLVSKAMEYVFGW